MNQRILLLIVVFAVAGLCGLYWVISGNHQPAAVNGPAATPAPAHLTQATSAESKVADNAPAAEQKENKPAPAPKELPLYESQIDQVLRSNVGETQTAKVLINMLPTLPEDGQVEAAQHIANLLPDSDYQSVLPTLLNPNTPESVSSVLFSDLMNRGDATKLNAFLEIAKVANHPNHEEALSDLQIFLDNDYGNDWAKWKTAITDYLAKQAAQ